MESRDDISNAIVPGRYGLYGRSKKRKLKRCLLSSRHFRDGTLESLSILNGSTNLIVIGDNIT